MTANRLVELQQQLNRKKRQLEKKTVPHQRVRTKKLPRSRGNSLLQKTPTSSLKQQQHKLVGQTASLHRRKRKAVKAQAFDYNEPIELRYNQEFLAVSESDSATASNKVESYRDSWMDSSAAYTVESFEEDEKKLPMPPQTGCLKTEMDAPEHPPAESENLEKSKPFATPTDSVEPVSQNRVEEIPAPEQMTTSDFDLSSGEGRASDADAFERDIRAILNGQKTARPKEEPEQSSQAESPHPEEQLETEIPSGTHAIFDRMGQNLAHATTFNLGAIELEQRFDAFDRAFDQEQQQSSANVETISVDSTEVSPSASVPEEMDLVEDLAIIDESVSTRQPAGSLETKKIYSSSLGRPLFSTLNSNYKEEVHDCPDISTSPNQCAVRLSRALIDSGVPMDSDYQGKLCRHGYARGAQDLGAFLKKKWGVRDYGFEAPNKIPPQLSGKKGVIMFANIPDFDGQGHIDLWDGTRTRTGSYWSANPIWFWELPDESKYISK